MWGLEGWGRVAKKGLGQWLASGNEEKPAPCVPGICHGNGSAVINGRSVSKASLVLVLF